MKVASDVHDQRRSNLIAKRMIIGAAIAFILIFALLCTVKILIPIGVNYGF